MSGPIHPSAQPQHGGGTLLPLSVAQSQKRVVGKAHGYPHYGCNGLVRSSGAGSQSRWFSLVLYRLAVYPMHCIDKLLNGLDVELFYSILDSHIL